jgi:phosphate transport system substrate-binding protein
MEKKSIRKDEHAVSPIVATLVLIVVAVVGAVAVGTIMGTFSTDVSKQANAEGAGAAAQTEILIAGSTTVQPASEELAKSYMEEHPGLKITVQGGGSGAGVSSAGMGIVDIGAASRALNDAEKASYPDLETYQIGGSAVVFITSDAATSVTSATKTELKDAYQSKAFAPNLTGIDDRYQRSEASGTEDTVSNYLLGSDSAMNGITNCTGQLGNAGMLAAVKAATTSGKYKLGFVDFGYAVDSSGVEVSGIKIIRVIDGNVDGSKSVDRINILAALKDNKAGLTPTTQSNNYPVKLTRPLNYIIKGTPSSVVKNFITYCQSPGAIDDFKAAGMFGITEFA